MITGTAAAVCVALQCVLTPRYGVFGAVISTMLTSVTMFVLTMSLSRKFYRFEASAAHQLTIAAAAVGGFFLGKYLSMLITGVAGGIAGTIAGLAVYAAALHFVRVITLQEVLGYGMQLLPRNRR